MRGIKLNSIKGLLGALTSFSAIALYFALLFIGYSEIQETRGAVEKELSYILRLQAAFLNSWFETTSANLAGTSALTSVVNNDYGSMLHDFQGIVENNKALESVAYADSEGRILLDASFGIRKPPFTDITDRVYFQEAKEKRAYVSSLLTSRVSGRPVIVFSQPVLRKGEFAGLVFYTVRFDTMVKLVENLTYGDTGRFFIVDRTGSSIEVREPELQRRFSEKQLETLAEEGLHRYKRSSGEAVWGSAIPISQRNFLIVAEIEEGERIKPLLTTGLALLLAFTAVLLLSVWGSVRGYGRISHSLEAVKDCIAGIERRTFVKIDAGRIARSPSEIRRLAIAFNSMVDAVKAKNDDSVFQGFHDPTTLLYNRQYFQEEVKRISSGRFDPVGLFICDVNGLEFVNDTLGHQAGDDLLREAAAAVQNCFRKGDLVARIGGDEFAVIITRTTREVMETASERLIRAANERKPASGKPPISFAFGYAWGDTKSRPLSEMMAEADDAMYTMKEKQRNDYREELIDYLGKELSNYQNLRQGHMVNCEHVMKGFAEFCRFPRELVGTLMLLARHHDIGYVGIPLAIANKKDHLSSEDFREIRRHPEIGYRIALVVPELRKIAEYIRLHHSWYNGEGYPPSAGEKSIPREARIMRIVDAFVSMTMDKTYRESITKEDAVTELRRCAGREFDPELVEEFVRYVKTQGTLVGT